MLQVEGMEEESESGGNWKEEERMRRERKLATQVRLDRFSLHSVMNFDSFLWRAVLAAANSFSSLKKCQSGIAVFKFCIRYFLSEIILQEKLQSNVECRWCGEQVF